MEYKENVKAVYENAFCMDSDCINYFEDMCMLCMSEEGIEIFPDSTVHLKARDSKLCKCFVGGTNLGYVF